MVPQRVGIEVRKSAVAPLRVLGVWVAIVGFVSAQFVDHEILPLLLPISSIGGIEISLNKIVALVIFPLAFALMGYIRIALPLTAIASVMILANSAAYVENLDALNPELLSANATVFVGFLAATMLYTALVQSDRSFLILGRVWVAFAAVTSLVVVGQVFGLLPLWAVLSDDASQIGGLATAEVGGLYRGIGFKLDPNYQALMLVLGLIFARFYVPSKFRIIFAVVIIVGLVGTFSRMGLLAAILAWVFASAIKARTNRRGANTVPLLKLLGTVTILALIFTGLYSLAPQEVQSYIDLRITETSTTFRNLAAGGSTAQPEMTSTNTRILLATTALRIFSDNYLLGVGAYRQSDIMNAYIGVDQTMHNTYLDELVTGGLLGVLVIVLYITLIVRALFQHYGEGEDAAIRERCVLTLILAFGLLGFFLTLNYYSIVWFPLVIALAHHRLSLSTAIEGRYAGP
jgi:O-antigen ligase